MMLVMIWAGLIDFRGYSINTCNVPISACNIIYLFPISHIEYSMFPGTMVLIIIAINRINALDL